MDIDPDKFNILEDMDQVMFCRPELNFKVTLKRYIVAANHSIITSEEDAEAYHQPSGNKGDPSSTKAREFANKMAHDGKH